MRKRSIQRRMPRNRFTGTPFKPYVIAIGQLTLAWNDLHEKLAALFCLLMDHQEEDDALIDDTLATPQDWHERDARLIGIWNSSNFDRPRREMLKAVIANSRQDHRKAFPKLIDDMTWVLQRADSLEEMMVPRRNPRTQGFRESDRPVAFARDANLSMAK